MTEELADRHATAPGCSPEGWKDRSDGCLEVQLAQRDQLENAGKSGDNLGQRGEVEDGLHGHRDALWLAAGPACGRTEDHAAAVEHERDSPGVGIARRTIEDNCPGSGEGIVERHCACSSSALGDTRRPAAARRSCHSAVAWASWPRQ